MSVIIIFVVAFIGLAIVARIGLANSTRERRSMSGHRHTLETISKVADASTAEKDMRTFKVEPLRPVRLDLSKLDDLTDPDLIRITTPLANDDPNEESGANLVQDDGSEPSHDVEGLKLAKESNDSTPTVQHDELSSNDKTSLKEPSPTGLVFGEDDVIGRVGDDDATVELSSAALGATQVIPQIDDVADQQSGDAERGQHRVYSTGRRSLPLSAMVIGAGAIAVVLGVGFFVLGRNSSSTSPSASPTVATKKQTSSGSKTTKSSATNKSTPTKKASTTTKKAASSASSGGGSTTSGSQGSSTTTTPASYTPVSANANYATYDIPGGPKTVVVSATQPCWVADSNTANGPLLWDETLPAGGSYTISSTSSSLWIKVGNAHDFQMQVNGVPVTFSSPPGVFAFNLVKS
jgi:hypothetical protein